MRPHGGRLKSRVATVALLLVLAAHGRSVEGRKMLSDPAANLLSLLQSAAAALQAPGPSAAAAPLLPLRTLPGGGNQHSGWARHLAPGVDPAELDDRILAGEPAPEEDWGFVASLVSREDNTTVFCGGALLDSTTVLTAAHCVVDSTTGLPIHPLSLWVEVQGRRLPPNLVLPHPGYKPSTLESDDDGSGTVAGTALHDIAVLRLAVPADGAPVVALPKPRLKLRPEQPLEVAGWGLTSDGGNESDVLLFAEVAYIADVADCPILPYNDTICAGNELTGARTCRGDSGSPLVLRDQSSGDATVVGLVAFSSSNCTEDMPYSRYTDVRQYLEQIAEWQGFGDVGAPRQLPP